MPFNSEPEGKFERRIFFSARAWWQDIRSALRFLTRLPLPHAPEPAELDFFDDAESGAVAPGVDSHDFHTEGLC